MRTRRRRAHLATPVLVAMLGLLARPALAQAENEAAARALFEEGRRLIKDGDYAGACPKFEAAAKIEAAPGVLLNLGDCYEHTNRTASAWTEFAQAEAVAARAGREEQAKEANRRKGLLGPKLCRLVIRVADDVPSLAVQRDGVPLDRSAWGLSLPVDPGEHVVTAGAPGRVSWSTSVRVVEPGDVIIEVPRLESSPAESTPARATDGQRRIFWTPRRVAEASMVGTGAVALATAGALALAAKGRENQAEGETGAAQVDDSWAAVHEGNAATVIAVAGGALAAAGILLFIVAPGSRAHATANASPLVLGGTF